VKVFLKGPFVILQVYHQKSEQNHAMLALAVLTGQKVTTFIDSWYIILTSLEDLEEMFPSPKFHLETFGAKEGFIRK